MTTDGNPLEPVIIESVPNPHQKEDEKIGYKPSPALESKDEYPIVLIPRESSPLMLPRTGRSDLFPYSLKEFLPILEGVCREFGLELSTSLHMRVFGRVQPYEPAVVLMDRSRGLFMDIEIDAPYDGFYRVVTHDVDSHDSIRDEFFRESGWVVVRFTEKQVVFQKSGCAAFLELLLSSLGFSPATISVPSAEEIFSYDLRREKRWTFSEAYRWEREQDREKYLALDRFTPPAAGRRIVCPDVYAPETPAIGRTPVHGKGGDEVTGGLCFSEQSHTYYDSLDRSGNSDYISVTTLIDRFFPFDEEGYIVRRMQTTGRSREQVLLDMNEAADQGTYLHKQIELFLKGLPYDDTPVEFAYFRQFHEKAILPRNLRFAQAEYMISLPREGIAGTVDSLFRKPDGEYVMVDWKRSRNLVVDGRPKKYGHGMGLSIISHLDNSSYYKYELQQSFYKYILEKEYGIKISSMILSVLHPDYDTFYSLRLSTYRLEEVLSLVEAWKNLSI